MHAFKAALEQVHATAHQIGQTKDDNYTALHALVVQSECV